MITKDEIQELLHSTETYRVERTTSTGDMDKFQGAICACAMKTLGYVNMFNRGVGQVQTDIQKSIIDLIEVDASISIDQMAVKLAVKKRTLEREIANMKQKGYISRTGSPRSGRWEVIIPYNCVIEIV